MKKEILAHEGVACEGDKIKDFEKKRAKLRA
jgi:hypothetical protein